MLRFTKSLLVIGTMALALGANAGEFKLESVGVRGGFGADGDDDAFWQYEAFAKAALPWRWDWANGWSLQTGLDLSAGILQRSNDSGFVGQLGPAFIVGCQTFPVTLELGSNPTIISRERFGGKDLGSALLFTSYVGLSATLFEHWSVGYRIQHASNAGFATPNPGLNMHLFSVSYRF